MNELYFYYELILQIIIHLIKLKYIFYFLITTIQVIILSPIILIILGYILNYYEKKEE